MSTNPTAAYGVFPQSVAVNEVTQALNQGGFDKESICMMLSPLHPIATIVRDSESDPFEREASAVTAGLIGWLSEFGAVVIPKFGFFVRSRKFFRALVVERDSIDECGRVGILASLGFAGKDAERFESQMHEGCAFLYVSCAQTAQSQWALELMRASGANEAGLLEGEAAMETAA
ncbi:MAG: hypothetical protein WCA16_14990 [Candidatus Sulfotelmatobacter sp.]